MFAFAIHKAKQGLKQGKRDLWLRLADTPSPALIRDSSPLSHGKLSVSILTLLVT